ncbi:MAG: ATP-dependent DNA ligase [Desulfobacterales bacterium]|nr:MAG: ATP-dependent DNA ligase [Desulfobacterales bacterium]
MLSTLLLANPVQAHFGMVIPSSDVASQDKKTVAFNLSFSHPFELSGMELAKPKHFSVFVDGKTEDLLPNLSPRTIMGKQGWTTNYKIKRPGVYQFLMEPQPYWEPAEDVFIIHYTKTIVAAFGADTDWDVPMGAPVEIVPLTRPFGNYENNSFTGQVLVNGKPAPNTEVEVELYNEKNRLKAPSDYHVTQVVKTDANGVFTFSTSSYGWWGFAALTEADYTMKHEKTEKHVELGGVLWVRFDQVETN